MHNIRLADYVICMLAEAGLDTAFLVTGGMAMHLNDALALEPRMRKVCCHHEQACALAAEGYAHVTGSPALVQVTSGPGAINAMTGVFGAFVDGLPMVIISGQPKREILCATYNLKKTRQGGEQESDAIAMASSITKYAVRVTDPLRIRYEMEKAWHIATSGRPGPVWLEIPVDVQDVRITPQDLCSFRVPKIPPSDFSGIAMDIIQRLNQAEHPLFVVGAELRRYDAADDFLRLAEKAGYPIVCAGTLDIVTGDHPLYAGAMGALGSRAGNIAVQNADCIVFFGLAMHMSFTTYNWQAMGKRAHKIVVEPDPTELERPQFLGDQNIVCNPRHLILALEQEFDKQPLAPRCDWLLFCKERLSFLPAVPQHLRTVTSEGRLNAYYFVEELFKRLENDIVVPSNGTAGVTAQQAGKLKAGQRLIANFGNGSMGFALPAAIGAAMAARPSQRVICLDGDGSFMLNMQELATIRYHNLPILIFIYNNGGYASVRQTQRNFFKAQLGYNSDNGLCFPDFVPLAQAFGIPARMLSGNDFTIVLDTILDAQGPLLVEVLLDKEQNLEPKISTKRLSDGRMVSMPPEDMAPFLPREELQSHLLFTLDTNE